MKQPPKKPFPIYQVIGAGSIFLFIFFMTTWQNGATWKDTIPLIIFLLIAGYIYASGKMHPGGSNIKFHNKSTTPYPIVIIFLALFSLPFVFPKLFEACVPLQHVIPQILYGGMVMYFFYTFIVKTIAQLTEGKKNIVMLISGLVIGYMVYLVIADSNYAMYYVVESWKCVQGL